ncbi:hypothetical protein BCR33DRAFT_194712 [Rhizoclosmatium globosum]|uniref:Uncharacterized protein n=1 Tax=Rhizoclosmatium globosum TaxID=329046 RepID=A0A1Y2CDT1_9FUNG|nr:hypothetical protein BCR33DRAFT_194712 [Rhizoclosmatium globosum]|eukprot:ORY45182.1 hypothetical protein BCR33DRAFT_194712 [Rhizoclosmatium globosum]
MRLRYIAFRSMTICGFKYRQTKRPCYTAAAISAVLYWILMAQVYSFNDSTNCAAYFKSNIPRVLLYSYWTLVDVVAAVGVIRKMRNAILEAQRLELDDTMDRHAFSILKFREELRLILVSVSMIAVTVVVIVQTTNPELPTYRVGTMVFVYCQLILVIGSKKVEVGARDSAVDYGDLGEQIQTVVRNISQRKREEQMITRQSFSQNQTNSLVV